MTTTKYLSDDNNSIVTHEKIMETAKQFKEINGNSKIPKDDMIIFILNRQENIYKELKDLSSQMKNQRIICGNDFATKSMTIWLFSFGFSLLSALTLLVLKLFGII